MNELKYKSVVFDLGKVIFKYSFSIAYEFWANAANVNPDNIKENFSFDKTFEDFERGKISSEQFRNEINDQLNLNLSIENFEKGWCSIYLEAYEDIDKLLVKLKKNYKLVALTNTNALHSQVWKEKYSETLQHFEKIFCSYELGIRKPENKIFEIVLDYLKSEPAETIFLDDNIENVNSAKAVGIVSILVLSQEQMYSQLRINGVLFDE